MKTIECEPIINSISKFKYSAIIRCRVFDHDKNRYTDEFKSGGVTFEMDNPVFDNDKESGWLRIKHG